MCKYGSESLFASPVWAKAENKSMESQGKTAFGRGYRKCKGPVVGKSLPGLVARNTQPNRNTQVTHTPIHTKDILKCLIKLSCYKKYS